MEEKKLILIMVCGLQGTGKTTVARKIAKKTGAKILKTDKIRKIMFEKPDYGEEESKKVYEAMFAKALKLLKQQSVVLDGTFILDRNRVKAREIAKRAGVNFRVVEVICGEGVARRRIQERLKKSKDEAGVDKYLEYKGLFEPIEEEHIIIENSGALDFTDKQIEKYF